MPMLPLFNSVSGSFCVAEKKATLPRNNNAKSLEFVTMGSFDRRGLLMKYKRCIQISDGRICGI